MKKQKRLLTLLLSFAMVLSMIPALTFSISAETGMLTSAQALEKLEGSGTAEDPYLIQSTQDWIWLAVASYKNPLLGKHFRQTTDLDFSVYFKNVTNGIPTNNALVDGLNLQTQYGFPSNNSAFFMLSARSTTATGANVMEWFAGNYDGQGYSVSGLYIQTNQNIGLFRQCAGGTIQNIVLKNSVFELTGAATGKNVGGIVGEVRGLTSTGTAGTNDQPPAVIEGRYQSKISGCTVEQSVTLKTQGAGRIGGIVGGTGRYAAGGDGIYAMYCELTIADCVSKAQILAGTSTPTSHVFAGGIIGIQSNLNGWFAKIENCTALGSITAQTPNGNFMLMVGGIAGDLASSAIKFGIEHGFGDANEVFNCYADVDITINGTKNPGNANSGVGGLIGGVNRNNYSSVRVRDCYVGGSITNNAAEVATNVSVGSVIGNITLPQNHGRECLTNVKYTAREGLNAIGKGIATANAADTAAGLNQAPAVVAKPFDKNSGEASLSLSEEKVGVHFIFHALGDHITAKLNGESYTLPQAVDGTTTVIDYVLITELEKTSKLELAVKVDGIEKGFSVPYLFSTQEYANRADEKLKPVVNALLQYGKYAKNYFDETAAALPDIEIVELENNSSHDDTKGLIYAGSSLLINEDTVLRHYFTLADGKTVADDILTVDGTALELNQKDDTQWYYVEFAVKAADLGKQFEIMLGNDVILTHSVLDYCAKALQDKENSKLVNLVKALYFYEAAANDFFTAG